MKLCTKEQREAALKIIGSEKIEEEIDKLSQKGKVILVCAICIVSYIKRTKLVLCCLQQTRTIQAK